MSKSLIFVYNAHSDAKNQWIDFAHKILKPSTYDCSLCALTFGKLTEKRSWKKFRTNASIEMKFLHKDEFEKQFSSKFLPKYNFPIVFYQNHYDLETLLHHKQINQFETTEELINAISKRLDLDTN